jgi:hypothetical protein
MRLSFIIVLLNLMLSFQGFSQNEENDPTAKEVKVKLTFSNEYENDRKNTLGRYMMRDEKGNIFSIKQSIGGIFAKSKDFIEKYSADMKQIFDEELETTQSEGNDLDVVTAFSFNGKPYIFAEYYNKVKDKRYLFALKVKDNGKLEKPLKIADFNSEKDDGSFVIKLSKDSSKLMVVSQLPVDKKDAKIPVAYSVLDKEFKEIWKGKASYPTEKEWGLFSGTTYTTVLDNFMVDNKGRVIALVQLPHDKATKEKGDSYNFYKLFVYENGVAESKKFTIDLNKKTIYSFQLLETSNPNEMIGVGTYSENKKIGWFSENVGTNGSFFFKINTETGVITNKSINPFTRKVFEFMRIDPKEQAKGEGINNTRVLDTWITDNNNVLLSMEQKYYIIRRSSSPMGGVGGITISAGRSTTTYYSSTMFNVKYAPDGKIIYQNYIPKSLNNTNTEFGMYHLLAPRGETHALVFNDHRKNTEKQLDDYKDMKTARPGSDRTVARLVTVDEAGKRKVSTLFSNKEEDFVLQPNISLKYAPGVIVTMGIDGKKFKLIKIVY